MKGLTSQPQPLQLEAYEVSQVATSSRPILPHANKLTPPAIYLVVRETHPLLGFGQTGGSEAQRALPLTLSAKGPSACVRSLARHHGNSCSVTTGSYGEGLNFGLWHKNDCVLITGMIDVPTFTDHDFLDDIKCPRCILDDNVRIVLLMKLPES